MLKNKHILITGASSGIGIEITKVILENGGCATLTYNSSENLKELQGLFPNQVKEIHQLNVFDQSGLDSFCEKISEVRFDGYLGAIGINIAAPLIGLSSEDIQKQLTVNLASSIRITQSVVKNMIRARKGSIVHLSSVSAHRYARGHSIYSASKAGLEGFSKAMASEVGKRNIRVNTISPGPVMTEMLKKSIELNGDEPHKRVPMNRVIEPREIADAAVFLLSEKSSAITGVNLPVDGGYILW